MKKSKSVRRVGKLRQTIILRMKLFPTLLLALLACNQAVNAASVTLYNTGVDSACMIRAPQRIEVSDWFAM
jgi:hypothetical protein